MSKKDRFSNLLSDPGPTGENQKKQIIASYVNAGIQETASTVSQESTNTEMQKPVKKKATFDMDKDLHTRLKTHAASKGVPMVDILEQLIRNYLQD